jgi:hypothetical protein
MMSEFTFEIELLDPVQHPTPTPAEMAPRLSSLEGKRVVLLENTKTNSDRLLTYIGEILELEYGVKEAVLHRKAHPSFPPADEVIDELAGLSDAVVTGIGD